MRSAFIEELTRLAREDRNIVLVVGDLGFGVVQKFADEFPMQFVNAGVAEQNMTGLAAGMALNGRTVLTYSIANFPVIRCLEQIRNDVCYHDANVKIVAVGGGMAYGSLGMTHHATEDLAIMRAMPNMVVLAPNDPVEARLATRAAIEHRGPVYLRLGKQGEKTVHASDPEFAIGKAIRMRDGGDATLLATGGLLLNAMNAAEILDAKGIHAAVISVPCVKPLDPSITQSLNLFTIEEHSIIGGLGGAVAELLAEAGAPRVFKRIALPDQFSSKTGDQEYLRREFGLDAAGIARTVERALSSR
ncbi:MAG TPA: transketolase C-terminal domain-containing protein [Thermoanaerobaculia bacterium]|nr:transketolase C-terminal domain-containing protein [Thermoanaerobaculia bacterium]